MMTWSHSREVKAELSRFPTTSDSQAVSELLGMWDMAGRGVRMSLGSAQLLRRAYSLAKRAGARPVLRAVSRRGRLHAALALGAPEVLPTSPSNPKAYLRGAFMARGYIADPDRSYHVEILAPTAEAAARVVEACRRLHLDVAVSHRRQGYAVYLKNQEQVGQFLAQIGAHDARLELASRSVMKSMRNQVNRLVNGETANLRRTVENGLRQAELLKAAMARPSFHELPAELRELARLRVAHPDWSLRELGRRLSPPLSKSGTAHRLRRLMRWVSEEVHGPGG
jgi:DNA-binding protein WhiA